MVRRIIFPRNRYKGAATAVNYFPRDRQKLAKLLGGATKVTSHVRVYDRSTNGVVDFEVDQGSFGEEMPAEAARLFTLTLQGQTPSLPYNSTNMANLPDDGTFYVQATMGLLDIVAKVSGGANTWVDFEMFVTAEFSQ
jgi:hypothetical protein